MPFNHYEGWSEKQLIDLRARLQQQGATGQVIRTSIAGVSVEKSASDPQKTDDDLKQVQYSLWLIGETKVANGDSDFNPYQNPYTNTIRRTNARYA